MNGLSTEEAEGRDSSSLLPIVEEDSSVNSEDTPASVDGAGGETIEIDPKAAQAAVDADNGETEADGIQSIDSDHEGKMNDKDFSTLHNTPAPLPKDFPVMVHDDTPEEVLAQVSPTASPNDSMVDETTQASTPKARGSSRRKRKRGKRMVRAARVDESQYDKPQGLPLPPSQYETTLIRRAIRKREAQKSTKEGSSTEKSKEEEEKDENGLEVYGDISLGMKLNIVGGKVIVQTLNALSDGRASPAQLTGVIKRGDVLLSINDTSLVNLPADPLMLALKPLSTPDSNGAYQRKLRLRLAAGEGLAVLIKFEEQQAKKTLPAPGTEGRDAAVDAASDMFSLFPMVDQLSGMPLFDDQRHLPEKESHSEGEKQSTIASQTPSRLEGSALRKLTSLDELISKHLAVERFEDRDRFLSEFYAWDENCPPLLKISKHEHELAFPAAHVSLTLSEMVELGRRATMGAKALSYQIENIDRGKDVRSFRSWSTTLSLYSRASTRRRYVLDSASLPVNYGKVEEIEEEEESEAGSEDSGSDEEQLDGDELLLRLAAHDEIWRKQVIEFLEKITEEAENPANEEESEPPKADDMDTALSNELGSFLFGENMSKILTKHKKPKALPPEEVTAVLFDLTTIVSTNVPDEITAAGSNVSLRSSLVPFTGIRRPPPGSDAMLATRFILDEALPAWLKTFRPLPWEHRRVLWPLDKSPLAGSTAASTRSDDSLTLDSMGTNQLTPVKKQRKHISLQEMIEDQELNVETRGETCFLVTYYFTQKLLPKLLHKADAEAFKEKSMSIDEMKTFVNDYGSYLKMHTCLAYSATLKAEEVIEVLLQVAKYDPRHREVMKQMSKTNALVFYEPTMLSAAVQQLHGLQGAATDERRQATIDFCASAYPDVQPWQVERECRRPADSEEADPSKKEALEELYYTYLSLLLHPLDGHDTARKDRSLVQEWCELSIHEASDETAASERRTNFLSVASRATSSHLAYHRDLVMLLRLSMKIEEYNLVLDLSTEILEDPNLLEDETALSLMLSYVREIGLKAIIAEEKDRHTSARTLKRIIRILQKAAAAPSDAASRLVDVPLEMHTWLKHKANKDPANHQSQFELIEFLAREALPADVLKTLSLWTEDVIMDTKAFPVLRTILQRAAHASMSSELSGSLLRLRRARLHLKADSEVKPSEDVDDRVAGQTLWKSMSNGMLTVAK